MKGSRQPREHQATGILGSPKFTKASARAILPAAAFQDTRWFMNTLTYFPLSFCIEEPLGLVTGNSQEKPMILVCYLPCNLDNKHAVK